MSIDSSWVPGCTLDPNARKARYGAMYVRAVAAQAGWASMETSPDEDRSAIDIVLECKDGWVAVQVKCGTRALQVDGVHHPVESTWVTKWSQKNNPVYMVYVSVPREPSLWIEHAGAFTRHATSAFWVRVDSGVSAPSVVVPRQNRFTANTLSVWRENLLAGYSARTDGVA